MRASAEGVKLAKASCAASAKPCCTGAALPRHDANEGRAWRAGRANDTSRAAPVVDERREPVPSASCKLLTISARMRPESRKRTSVFAGCTFTSTKDGARSAVERMRAAGAEVLSYKSMFHELFEAVDGSAHRRHLAETLGAFPADILDE